MANPWNSYRMRRSTCISGYIYRTECVPKIYKNPISHFCWYPIQHLEFTKLLSALCGFAFWRRNQHVQHILVLPFAGSAHGPHHRCGRLCKAKEGEKAIGQGLQSQLLKGTTCTKRNTKEIPFGINRTMFSDVFFWKNEDHVFQTQSTSVETCTSTLRN